jgi:hypothetical protein
MNLLFFGRGFLSIYPNIVAPAVAAASLCGYWDVAGMEPILNGSEVMPGYEFTDRLKKSLSNSDLFGLGSG